MKQWTPLKKFSWKKGKKAYQFDKIIAWRCRGYFEIKNTKKGHVACEYAVTVQGNDGGAGSRIFNAELYVMEDEFDKADKELDKMENREAEKVRGLREKIARLRKAANRKDYYKLLSVPKTATEQDINKAFRKLAKEYHPDVLRSKNLSPRRAREVRQAVP